MSPGKLVDSRDPYGFRLSWIGRRENTFVVASETCALDIVGAEFIRDVRPGEVLLIDANGMREVSYKPAPRKGLCIFEYIYFARR